MHSLVTGKVQGVGFRYTTLYHAKSLNIVGTVSNLPNGQVEIFAQGSKDDLDRLIHLLKTEAGYAKVATIQSEFYPIKKVFDSFGITTS